MVLSEILLSIFIPTYNRAPLLNHLLESIAADLEPWPSDLEIIISDNASTDNTKEVVTNFLNLGAPIIYVVNDTNLGPDRNITAGFRLASGQHLWVIGDDEIMYYGAIRIVLALCRENDFGILHIANQGFAHEQQEEIKLRRAPHIIKKEFIESEKFFRICNIFLTFISANVINRQAILDNYPDFDANIELDTNLAQLSWIYCALKAKNIHCYVKTPLFGALADNTSGYKLIEVFGVNLPRITAKYMTEMIPRAEQIITNAVVTRLLPRQLMSQFMNSNKKNQFLDGDILEATEKCFKGKLLFKLFLKPILSASSIKRKIAFFFVRAFNFVNRKLHYILL